MTTNIISNTPKSERNEWRTPIEVFRWVKWLIRGIDFDTACTLKNALARPIWWPLPVWHPDMEPAPVGNALSVAWHGKCFNNPPYDDIDPWCDYAIAQEAVTAMLIPSPNGEERYERLIANSHEISIIGRLPFIRVDGIPISVEQFDLFGESEVESYNTGAKAENTRGSSLFIINGYSKGTRTTVRRDWIFERFGGVV